ncbi:mycofactocin-coupled SDR family oxidoreductase [Gordonia jinghuaiqii]|uniref:Mycofactocin-coupled SDR family oxidoreductase n=1 Tax=Gordonia jinghuaiqii TaxID=2758710 RepID=A0A7D7QGK0_9ACTN|nr:mycofactocin-coupled SDR family oxidoreductase [Gordonia jinghuaiqii]MCR5978010.1 mycofactocin-coupled SDR family oxidoreductase [Gordonia jinghuaiqii]QMT01522.1 mycofactocin-coupled SDR family oxidoreductase [Gordonia jinghuaiqii]
MNRMEGKVALITGGARGQGREHARQLAAEGADIIITDICEQIPGVKYPMATPGDLEETVAIVEGLGRRCLAYIVDARDVARMREVTDAAVAELGHLDTVVINHGIAIPHEPDDPDSYELWDAVITTNLSGVYRTASVVIPHLKNQGGSITVIGSSSSIVAHYNNPSYTASKHGVIGLVKSLAADLSQYWIRVNAVCPTAVATDMFINDYNLSRFNPGEPNPTVESLKFPATALHQLPVPWIEPEAVTKAVLYLASDDGKYVTGVALPVDAGTTTQPPGITAFIGQRIAELS